MINNSTDHSIMGGLFFSPAVLMQFAGGAANFDIVKEQAFAGKGMGWAHMYADGPNTLSIIPRRDFSSLTIKYTR